MIDEFDMKYIVLLFLIVFCVKQILNAWMHYQKFKRSQHEMTLSMSETADQIQAFESKHQHKPEMDMDRLRQLLYDERQSQKDPESS